MFQLVACKNNVFGKNTKKNQLKYHIKEIKLILENESSNLLKKLNKKIFELTIGGFGLTGVIISAKIKLKNRITNNSSKM